MDNLTKGRRKHMTEGADYEIKDTLNKALALTRSIGRLAEEEPNYLKESDMGAYGRSRNRVDSRRLTN